ncbi:hypothetical protein DFP72DRAFT_985932 [Ephemerocybe angulata]|uniref:PIN domain-containing protein n=1 Tax=Ephemerocybe angulata TaxID=980116 RepID=A0A8H6MGH6_9AGAR|nr:hypothetical protein DFP72DRAFT_985932 [Tulosesus angulatus]
MHLESLDNPQRSSRKGKERDPSHPPTRDREPQGQLDLADKIIAHRRKNAGAQRMRDRAEREGMSTTAASTAQNSASQPQSSSRTERSPRTSALPPSSRQPVSSPRKPQAVVSRPAVVEADHEEFSRRLKISSRAHPLAQLNPCTGRAHVSKLYNPDTDSFPIRRTAEPEQLSDTTGSSYVQVPRQLADDPVRFQVLTRPPSSTPRARPTPTPKGSGDYVSASSASSYAPSVASSTFTLSSTTDGSSASSGLFDGPSTKVNKEDPDDMDVGMGRVLLKGGKEPTAANTEVEKDKWKTQISDHKQCSEPTDTYLPASPETIHSLLELSLDPKVPVSLRTIPTKYNIVIRLWSYGFHRILESLRRSSFTSQIALEHLQDFIFYAYTYYTAFKSAWLEALGDLARYKMAVAAMVNGTMSNQGGLTTKAVTEITEASSLAVPRAGGGKSISDGPAARIDDSPSPSVGITAARLMDIEPEKERWRNVARDWYGAGVAEQPGAGKLHHHLGLLSREVESEELRAIYHFTKSMTTLHPFMTSRESILPMWSTAAQTRRAVPDARVPELFVLLHGMLFTNIQLDDFQPTLARFIERLDIEGAEEKEWIMMAAVNITAILEYGRASSLMRKLGVVGPKDAAGTQQAASVRVMRKKAAAGVPGAVSPPGGEDMMDVDDDYRRERDQIMRSPALHQLKPMTPPSPTTELPDCPPALNYAMQLTFAMLSLVLRRPLRQPSAYARSTLNPYLTVILTFLSTILKQSAALHVLERSIPWQELATFFGTIPRRVMTSQGLFDETPASGERWAMLTSGVSPPLAEDWCMRGMEWVGRKVFERGYWKSSEDRKAEMEVLDQMEGVEISDGTIEDDDEEDGAEGKARPSALSDLERRWIRIARSAVNVTQCVDGLTWKEGTREWKVEGKLAQKVEQWKEEDRLEREEEERRRMGRRWTDDAMEIDENEGEMSSESEAENDDDSEEVKQLKARRRYLKSILASSRQSSPVASQPRTRTSKKASDPRPALPILSGYTILVVDTNIVLSSLNMITSLVESMKWTVVIPLPVVMELDGLASNSDPVLAEAASSAINYISSHIRSHSVSLKVQTSKGNYLSSLTVRTEDIDFSTSNMRSMDDLILKAAIWQDEHWQDRSSMLKVDPLLAAQTDTAVKVVFLTLDRNLRLKSRSRQLPAASEKDLAALMALAT